MKIEQMSTMIKQDTNVLTRIKKLIYGNLKLLEQDTFEKDATQKLEEKIVSRKHPNWCDTPEDTFVNNTIAQRICYYPEDEKLMETMTGDERWKYKDYLDNIGRFYYDENYHVDTPALDKFNKEHGIDISQFVIKDKK